jgi:hypothetical protein
VGRSTVRVITDGDNGNQTIALGDQSPGNLGVVIEDFFVGDEKISFDANNWDASSLGQLDIDGYWQGRWTVR